MGGVDSDGMDVVWNKDKDVMLRIVQSASVGQAKRYYSEGLTREGYYSEGQEMAGQWGGRGAQRLGLSGPLQKDAFDLLCDNLNPVTGSTLTARTKANRRVGYDFVFSVPKSVTIAYALGKDDRILTAFKQVVRESWQEIERDAATRVRIGGDGDRITQNLICAEFFHFTARPVEGSPDPHLHAHLYTINATFDPVENKWKAAQFGDIIEKAPYYQAAFLMRLAVALRGLGYEIQAENGSFEIKGVPRSLNEKFSRRAKLIEAKADELGLTDPAARHDLAASTRERKIKDVLISELEPVWEARLSAEEKLVIENLKNVRVQAEAMEAGLGKRASRKLGERLARRTI